MVFGYSLPSSKTKKKVIQVGPPLAKLSGSAHVHVPVFLKDYPIHIGVKSMGLPTVYFIGFLNYDVFLSLKNVCS